jgi:hypothetical protein
LARSTEESISVISAGDEDIIESTRTIGFGTETGPEQGKSKGDYRYGSTMRLPRMTTRRWMVVVVVVGLLGFLVHRHRSLASRAAYHESKMVARMFLHMRKYLGHEIPSSDIWGELHYRRHPDVGKYVYFDGAGKVMTADEVRATLWHEALARKYRQAARYPWFPVMPDPPEPRVRNDSSGDRPD